jgi:predicted dehydrogenase
MSGVLRTLVVGLGRSGAGLHIPVVLRARSLSEQLFADAPVVAVDPYRTPMVDPADVTHVRSLDAARRLVDPARTVVHLCTPPDLRAPVLERLAELGFRRLIVEKPLAVDEASLAEVLRLRARYELRLVVVAHWLTSALTARLLSTIESGDLGTLRVISVRQRKPRFRRSLATAGHASAFDIEIPHPLGVALRLAGAAEVTEAGWEPMTVGGVTLPHLGGAHLTLRHVGGVRTDIASDLTSPVRERRISLRFDEGEAVGHFAASEDDEYARLTVTSHGTTRTSTTRTEVFPDDALTAFMLRAYQDFSLPASDRDELATHADVVRLLCAARHLSAADGTAPVPARPADHAAADGAAVQLVAVEPELAGRASADQVVAQRPAAERVPAQAAGRTEAERAAAVGAGCDGG